MDAIFVTFGESEKRIKEIFKKYRNFCERTEKLAERYNFSGGEIDNIVRKLTMKQVIDGSDICIDEIEKLCSHEKLHDEERRIGFGNF